MYIYRSPTCSNFSVFYFFASSCCYVLCVHFVYAGVLQKGGVKLRTAQIKRLKDKAKKRLLHSPVSVVAFQVENLKFVWLS